MTQARCIIVRSFVVSFLVIHSSLVPANRRGDFSGAPISKKRAYGRVGGEIFLYEESTLKRVGRTISKAKGRVVGNAEVYVLSLRVGEPGAPSQAVTLSFSVPAGTPLTGLILRRRTSAPIEIRDGIKLGVIGAQLQWLPPGKARLISATYRNKFSARIELESKVGNMMKGQVIVVTPDEKRSYIAGAFKAELVGFTAHIVRTPAPLHTRPATKASFAPLQ